MSRGAWYDFLLRNPARNAVYYAITQCGQGGFGSVWAGFTDAMVPIAIKLVKPTSEPLRDFIRWHNEQSIHLQCLFHPHIVTTYDQFCCADGSLIIVMERAEGSLHDYLMSNGRLHPLLVCSIGIQLAYALEHIHWIGVVHRDITLKNILYFANGAFKLSDFGISKQLVSAEEFARTFVGAWNSIPPELLHAGYSSFQSDIYQLGLVLLTLLTGEHPIPANLSVEHTLRMITDGRPRQAAEGLVQEFGPVAEVLSVMLRRREEWRFRSAREVREALQAAFDERQAFEKFRDWRIRRQQRPQLPPTL
jgi:eukaryotic-like serine/threonine-protein kinase